MNQYKKVWNWGVIALMALVLTACGGAQERAAAHLARGKHFLEQKDYPKAKIEFKNVLQINPKSSKGYYYLGRVAEAQQQWPQAYGDYSQALTLDPNDLEARKRLAHLLVLAHQTSKAEDQIKKILAAKPNDVDGLTMKAAVLVQEGKDSDAEKLAQSIVEKAPKHSEAAILLAYLYEKHSNSAKAIEVLARTAKLLPNNVEVHLQLANAYAKAKQVGNVEGVMNKLIAEHPDVFGLRVSLAAFYSRIGEKDKAEKTLRDGIKAEPDDPERYLALADFLNSQYGADKAAAELQSAISAHPDLTKLRFGLAKLYGATHSLDKAAKVYQAIIQDKGIDTDGLKARDLLAAIRVKQGKQQEAKKLINEVLDESPDDNGALMIKGKLALADKNYTEAVSDFRTILKGQPNSVEVLTLLAEANFRNGDTSLARDNLERAAKLHPDDVDAGLRLARLLFAMKNTAAAEKQVDAVLKVHPKNVKALVAKSDILAARNDTEGLEATLRTLQEVAPKDPLGFDRMGRLYRAQHKNDAALKQFKKAYGLAPDSLQVLGDLTSTEIAMGKTAKAEQRIKDAIVAHPKAAPLRQLQGEVFAAQRKYGSAAKAFEKAITLQHKWWAPYNALASARAAQGDNKGAVAAYEQGLKSLPDNPQLMLGLAQAHNRMGDIDGAAKVYEQLLAKEPGNAIAANNLASLIADHRSNDPASLAKAKKLVAQFGSSKQLAFLDTYGWVHYRLGDLDKAAKALSEVVQKAPKVPVFQYHLGMVYYKQGNKAAAKEHLTKALAGGSKAPWAGSARRALNSVG